MLVRLTRVLRSIVRSILLVSVYDAKILKWRDWIPWNDSLLKKGENISDFFDFRNPINLLLFLILLVGLLCLTVMVKLLRLGT